ncbi:MAG TPA: septation protein A [Rhizomicrobium sp.]|jgi:intracellular septation protein|nr:septation protein A [Rhizomicrobium sp.]
MSPQTRRQLLDLGPAIVFFAAFEYRGIFVATGAVMIAALVALGIGFAMERRLLPMPLFTALLVLIFGGLTLYLKNEMFIKIKVTILYCFFGAILLGGMAFKRLFIKYVFAQAFELDEPGWRQLTWRWGLFFLALALLNELVWRNASTAAWVTFKVWGIIPLIFLFALAQTPFVMKHHIEPGKNPD